MSAFLHQGLSRKIIGAAMTVMNGLRPGLDEKVYENALVIELRNLDLKVDQQKRFPIHYRGELVGTLIPDLIVADKVIVDTKVVSAFNETHMAQMLGYLAITELELALLINFKNARIETKRVIRDF